MRNQMLLFGGYACDSTSACSLRNDTWEWNGSSWAQLADTSPSARTHTAMTYDPVLGGLYQLGGDYITSPSNEARLWNGGSWQVVDQTPVPPFSRSGVALAYEPGVPGRMLGFGGDQITTATFDTQTTVRPDGAFWTAQSWPSQPPARRDGKLVHDPIGAKTYLFGGRPCHITTACPQQDDYWELTGTTWSNLGVGVRAPARSGFGFVYDSARQLGVVFGGRSDSAPLSDLWEIRFPDTWEEIGPLPGGPPARAYHAMAYDSDREVVVLFGGVVDMSNPSSTTSLVDDTWELSVVDLTCTTAAQCPSGSCVDGVCCDEAACGLCETCGDPISPGTCTAVLSADDPDSCAVTCDASGSCSVPLECEISSDCDGPCERCDARVCVSRAGEQEPACGPFLCGTGSDCPQSCASDQDCADGFRCDDEECVDLGKRCSAGVECLSGACVDGVCCDQTCDVCSVCSVSAGADVDGECKALPAGTEHPACELACDGEGRCASAGLGEGAACNEHRECASGSCVEHTCCGASPRSCIAGGTGERSSTAFDAEEPGTGCACSLPGSEPRASRVGSERSPSRSRGLGSVVLLVGAGLVARRRGRSK